MLGTGLFATSIWILFLATGDNAYCSEDSDEKSTSSESEPLGHTSVIKNKTSDTKTLSEYQSRKRDKNIMTRVNSDKTSSAEILDSNDSQHVKLIQETTERSDGLSDSSHSTSETRGVSVEQKASKASDNTSEHVNGTTETISESFEFSHIMDGMSDSSNLDNADTETSDESVLSIAEKSDNYIESYNSDESPDANLDTDETSDETSTFDFDHKIAKTSDELSNSIQSQDDLQTKGNSARKHDDDINNEAVVSDEIRLSSDKSSKSLTTGIDPSDSDDKRDKNDRTIDRSDRSSNHVDVDDDVSALPRSKTPREESKRYDKDNESQTASVKSDDSHEGKTVDNFTSSANETESSESDNRGKTSQDTIETKTKSDWSTSYFNRSQSLAKSDESTLDGDSVRSSERSKSNRAENRRRRRHQSSNSEFKHTTELSWLNDSDSDSEGSKETNEEIGSTEAYVQISHSVQNRQTVVLEQNESTSSAKTDKTHMPTTVPEMTTAFTGASVYATAARSAESKQDQNDDIQNESSSTTTIAAASSAAGVAAVGSTVALIYKLAARLRRAAISSR